MEILRSVGSVATLITMILNVSLFVYQVNVLQYEYNKIHTEVVE